MKLVHIVGAVFLLAGGAAAQDGGKAITKTITRSAWEPRRRAAASRSMAMRSPKS